MRGQKQTFFWSAFSVLRGKMYKADFKADYSFRGFIRSLIVDIFASRYITPHTLTLNYISHDPKNRTALFPKTPIPFFRNELAFSRKRLFLFLATSRVAGARGGMGHASATQVSLKNECYLVVYQCYLMLVVPSVTPYNSFL